MKDTALEFKTAANFIRIDEIAVMRNRKISLNMPDNNGLNVIHILSAGCGISYMTYRNIALTESVKSLLCKNIGHQTVALKMSKYSVIIYRNAATFLSSMLKSIESEVNILGYIAGFRHKYTENSALLMNTVKHILSSPSKSTLIIKSLIKQNSSTN